MLRRRAAATLAVVIWGFLAACGDEPRGPGSPDPARFLVEGRTPVAISFGPTSGLDQVATLTTPQGPIRVEIAEVPDGEEGLPPPDTVIDGIRVRFSENGVVWFLPPTRISIDAEGIDLRPLVPLLVEEGDASHIADVLAANVDGAEVTYAGLANAPDITVTYDDGTTSSFNSRENRERPEGEEVDAATFADVVEHLLADAPPPDGIDAVRIVESDVGDLLEVDPPTDPLTIGDVELHGAVEHGRFTATLTHAESRLLSDALSPPRG